MCLKGLAKCSWQKGSLPTVQISVSCDVWISQVFSVREAVETYRLEVLLQFAVQSTTLECNDLRGSIRVVGNGRAALGAKESVDDVTRAALGAGIGLDGAVDGKLVLLNNGDESFR